MATQGTHYESSSMDLEKKGPYSNSVHAFVHIGDIVTFGHLHNQIFVSNNFLQLIKQTIHRTNSANSEYFNIMNEIRN